jgi:hypothetical protein
VDDADDFDAVFKGPVEDGVIPNCELSELRGVLLRSCPDFRVRRVQVAGLLEFDCEAVCSLGVLTIEVIEDFFQVLLSLVGANDAGHQAAPLPFRRRLRTFASDP